MTITAGYILAATLISAGVTLLLRTLPFAILSTLRESAFVQLLGRWMPVGILLVLVVVVGRDIVVASASASVWWIAPVSLAVTVITHLLTRRRTVWSVAAGTSCYVSLLTILA